MWFIDWIRKKDLKSNEREKDAALKRLELLELKLSAETRDANIPNHGRSDLDNDSNRGSGL